MSKVSQERARRSSYIYRSTDNAVFFVFVHLTHSIERRYPVMTMSVQRSRDPVGLGTVAAGSAVTNNLNF